MRIHLDHHSGEPIYRQIVEAVKLMVARSELEAGAKLPSIRELASDLKINPRTVVKAYEKLDGAGLVVMQHGRGVFITAPQSVLPVRERKKVLQEQAQRLMAEAARIGADPEEVLEVVQNVAKDMVAKQ
jgi:GntR family transcriptional regulator